MHLSVPGKTFIAGEYLVLQNGKALISATAPRFSMHAVPGKTGIEGFHPESPAGILLSKNRHVKDSWQFVFEDPYKIGGFGASTAQFLAVASVVGASMSNTAQFLQLYRDCAWNGEGLPPSGADLLGQWQGGLSLFDPQAHIMAQVKWPFADLKWTLIATGQKLATHTHLRALKELNTSGMQKAFVLIESALTGKEFTAGTEVDSDRRSVFLQGIRDYAIALRAENLTAPHSVEILDDLSRVRGVLAAKACGAMGADVIVAFHDAQSGIDEFLTSRKLQKIASDADLSEGLKVEETK